MGISRKLVPLVFAGVAALVLSVPTYGYSPYTFSAQYVIDDIGGTVTYSESGTFAQYPTCSLPWQDQAPSVLSTTDTRHIEEYRFDTVLSTWVHITQQNLLQTFVQSLCPAQLYSAVPGTNCPFNQDWTPTSDTPVSSPYPMASGWHDLDRSQDGKTSIPPAPPATSDDIHHRLDLTYLHARPLFTTSTGFTGRLALRDEALALAQRGMSGSMFAGRCLSGPGSYNHYTPGSHNFLYSATKGIIDANDYTTYIPGYGPIGTWQLWMQVCNDNCV